MMLMLIIMLMMLKIMLMMMTIMLIMMMMTHCSREAKHRLEMDWSDKYSAQHLGQSLLKFLI